MSVSKTRSIPVVRRILAANDRVAHQNRGLFAEHGIAVINLISSPGTGKTTLLERSLPLLSTKMRTAVIAGDIATTRDADRLAVCRVPVVQITTESFGGSCHLEASTILQALEALDLEAIDLLFIENVGNLVCPAEFDLGERAKVALLSITEGEDKPLKYPLAFQQADLVLVTKVDLLPHLRFDMQALRDNLKRVNPHVQVLEIAAQTGEGMEGWTTWLVSLATHRSQR